MVDIAAAALTDLQALGFSPYEAKAYLALLRGGRQKGYEVAKGSGVPRSMVYQALERLVSRGAAYRVEDKEGVFYGAVPPEELLSRFQRDVMGRLARAKETLSRLTPERPAEAIWRVQGVDRTLAEARSLVEQAEQALTLSLWQEQLDALHDALLGARERGVHIRLVLFGERADPQLGKVYYHHFVDPKVVEGRLRARLFVVVRDHGEVVVGNLSNGGDSWAVRTRDPALVLVAEEYVRHDVVLAEMTLAYGVDKLTALWTSREDLRRMVTGEEVHGAS
ncbi:TrmB family transcriptional regulator [Thermus tengchongensis]|uniref:TrmB family transcriptional regulator n=1 Tax=Thermus tengchongensis TaxID=1214928 RepID=A0A4Y9EVY2_9DEIN|nr:helix-turn-helix domain-containing protein [Thermus tengchongensis]TFU14873.1 TrmB family transcriptional regulator [Thermus tengchongensis]TFU25307.1 TrmB family transcriptional regulator [Thermus tengchongensis]